MDIVRKGKPFQAVDVFFLMLKSLYLLVGLFVGTVFQLQAQITKEFIIDEKEGVDLVRFDFSSYNGSSHFKGERYGQPVRAHAHLSKVNILPSFTERFSDGILYAGIDHHDIESQSLGKRISRRIFSGENKGFEHSWFIDLDQGFLYTLNFDLGMGKAQIDLTDLQISRCKVKSTTADVSLGYFNNTLNRSRMDTLLVSINMGTIDAHQINYSNAEKMFFDINYGTVNLSMVDDIPKGSTISAMVGAGSISIDLPSGNLPYIIKVKSTAMCKTTIAPHLKRIDHKTYVSKGYKKDADNLVTFLVDVSVGTISLK